MRDLENQPVEELLRGAPPPGLDRTAGGPAPDRPAAGEAPPQNAKHAAYAKQMREEIPASFIYLTLGRILKDLPAAACKIYRDRLLRDCGNPTDPILVMLIEQLANAHMNIGVLNYKAAATDSVEVASAYWAASARLQAEFRRGFLALQEYRAAAIAAQARDSAAAKGLPIPEEIVIDTQLVLEADKRDESHTPIRLAEFAAG